MFHCHRNETTYKNILDEDNRETPGHDGKFTYSMLVQNIYVEPCITIEMPGWHKTGLFSMVTYKIVTKL